MCRELPPLLFSPAAAPECSTRCNRHSPPAWQAAPLLAEPLRLRSSLARRTAQAVRRGSCQVRIRARKGNSGTQRLLLARAVPPEPFIYQSDTTRRNDCVAVSYSTAFFNS